MVEIIVLKRFVSFIVYYKLLRKSSHTIITKHKRDNVVEGEKPYYLDRAMAIS